MAALDEHINRDLAARTGFSVEQVCFLRQEFKKFGRNPMDASIEIVALENGFDEQRVKLLFDLHQTNMRRLDGLSEQKRMAYDDEGY